MPRRKAWLTPDTPAPEATRCRSISVPDDLLLIGAVTGALLPLTQSENWEESGSMTPQEAADIMSAAFEGFVASECTGGDCPPFVFPDTEIPVYRQNPSTGRWEYIGPDGWVEPMGEGAIPEPDERAEATEALQQCGAASNAANSLKDLYEAILSIYDSEVDPLLNQIEIAAQIAVAYGTSFGPVSQSFLAYAGAIWETFTFLLSEITMDDWTTDWHEELVCILKSNVTMVDGVARFDLFNVNNDLVGFLLPVVDGYVRVRWQTWFLIQCIGSQGLDVAGATTAVEGDCVTCDSWCFTATPGFFNPTMTQGYINASGYALQSWYTNSWRIQGSFVADTTYCTITRFSFTFTRLGGTPASNTLIWFTPTAVSNSTYTLSYAGTVITPDNPAMVSTGDTTTFGFEINQTDQKTVNLTSIKIWGTGINPFSTGSNC